MADEAKFTHFNGPTYEHDKSLGLSRFLLTTYDENNGPIQLKGLLSELPEFSFTINYEKGPGSEWQDTIANFMANDMVASFNAIGAKSQSFKNIINAGTWTKMVYNGYSTPSIPLKFRIYTSDPMGQSSASEWLAKLKQYATLNAGNQFSIKNAGMNILTSLLNAYNTGMNTGVAANNIAEIYFDNKNNNTADKSQTDDKTEKVFATSNKVVAQKCDINRLFSNAMDKANSLIAANNDESIQNYSIQELSISHDIKNDWIGNNHNEPLYLNYKIIANRNVYEEYKIEVGNQISTDYWGDVNPNDINLDINAIISKLKELVEHDRKLGDIIFTSKFFDDLTEISQRQYDNKAKDDNDDKLRKILTEIAKLANDSIVGKYGQYRVFQTMNATNSLGEKLWHLNIYDNVIFKQNRPLVVYVSEWSVKPSDEIVGEEPVYYDFEVNCVLDQVYSRETWISHLAENDKQLLDHNK